MQQNLKLADKAIIAYNRFMKWSAIIVAAGTGSRANLACPKQYQPLQFANQYEAIVVQSVRQILPFVEAVQVVIHKNHEALYKNAFANLQDDKILSVVYGGSTRQESVRLGLESLPESEFVLIHDGARPFVSHEIITNLQQAVEKFGAAVPTLPSSDSLCYADEVIGEYLPRSKIAMIQTPQGFKYSEILKAHKDSMTASFDDDASLAIANGISVARIKGEVANKKITLPEDFVPAHKYRMTSGFDVHAFGDGNNVRLCGVEIPHNKSLQGHSDADVALHALCDAMLASAEVADIGQQFPPSDPQWKNADSSQFIKFALQKLQNKNIKISFVDITIICEEPKIAPHRNAMIENLEKLLGVKNCIAIKATTTEKLGALGQGDGIAAMATLTVVL